MISSLTFKLNGGNSIWQHIKPDDVGASWSLSAGATNLLLGGDSDNALIHGDDVQAGTATLTCVQASGTSTITITVEA